VPPAASAGKAEADSNISKHRGSMIGRLKNSWKIFLTGLERRNSRNARIGVQDGPECLGRVGL
jgi:hypothetical protein